MIVSLEDVDVHGKVVIVREDFNVPIVNGEIQSDIRLKAALPTIQHILSHGGTVILLSHLGRPQEGQFQQAYSLSLVANRLSTLLAKDVHFISDWVNGFSIESGEIYLCENVRFCKGEKQNDEELSKKMAALGDIFVMDAFASCHRAHASTAGIMEFAAVSCMGPLLEKELKALAKAVEESTPPVVAIVGGSKVSSKIGVIDRLIEKVDTLIVGGGIANTFLQASEIDVGQSLCEHDQMSETKQYIEKAKRLGCEILMPSDVVVGEDINARLGDIKSVTDVLAEERIFDVGPRTVERYAACLNSAGTILWNGPVGVFENETFAQGTMGLAMAIANSKAFSVAGGGDTLSAIANFAIEDKISYISTGGGAFLEWLEGKTLPSIAALEKSANGSSANFGG